MEPVRVVLLLLLVCAVQVCFVRGIRLELSHASGKCLSEDIPSDVIVVGNYRVVTDNLPQGTPVKIKAQILSPHSERLHFGDNVEAGHFGFDTKISGIYTICFWLDSNPSGHTINVDFDMKTGMAAKDWNSIAKKEKIEGMELELRRLQDSVDYIRREMLRESEMRNINEITNARVAWFSIGSLFICLTVAGWQLWHLKSFFERKKLV
ncbi:hypothetical protein O6H91_10G061200 [Diphasiastrum complanatum]|uniref:Uncharacterized protein n=1 Tax=Diphasiastrum complanatum TaxID=34168 RepID=A0ACC2CHE7_DIPCM|nr:hypothetical protein O6H91_10G061200 [Diphasiastrum complanatum]